MRRIFVSNQFSFIDKTKRIWWQQLNFAVICRNLSDIGPCAVGYAKNLDTNECDDINECDTGEAQCDTNNQACLNTIGSYKCLDIIGSEKKGNCEEGFRYQARIDQCVGEFLNLILIQFKKANFSLNLRKAFPPHC
jgi:hypothetical protein